MKKTFALWTLLLLAMTALVLWSDAARQAVHSGLLLCAQSVIPALFPFFVASSLLISLGFAQFLGSLLEDFMRPLFGVGGSGASAFMLGLLGGYPVGARTAADLFLRRLCTREEAEHLLAFCNNCSPAFVLAILGQGVFHSSRAGGSLYLIHILAALLTGIVLRCRTAAPVTRRAPALPEELVPLAPAFVDAVQSSLQSILSVCAFVVLFMVLLLPLQSIPGLPGHLLVGSVELFNGAARLPDTAAAFPVAAGLLGWGGLSVHCQTVSVLRSSGLSTGLYWKGKALQAVLSFLLALPLTPWALGG